MAKPKVDFKELLLKKGEYIALGIAGLGLVILLLWGVSEGTSAANPTDISKKMTDDSQRVVQAINNQNDTNTPPELPEWARPGKKLEYNLVKANDFRQSGPFFDPVGRPDTKRENPRVMPIEEYEAILVRAPMKGFDITYVPDPGNPNATIPQIAVRVPIKKGEVDKDKLRDALAKLTKRASSGNRAYGQGQAAPRAPGPGGGGPGSIGPRPGGGGGSSQGPAPLTGGSPNTGSSLGPTPGGGESSFGFGGTSSGFSHASQRSETAIEYVNLEDLDKAIAAGKIPATTVVPLRLAIVNATFPIKQQMEEVKRAMRFKTAAEAAPFIQFDGFEVRRKITQVLNNGQLVLIQDWADYKYEDKYVELINARKLNDYIEGADPNNPDGAYLSYFYKYEDALVMPLPELVSELGSYPKPGLKSINDAIDRLKKANTPKQNPSDLIKRLRDKAGQNDRKQLFTPQTGQDSGASDFFGKGGMGGVGVDPVKPGAPKDPKNLGGGGLEPSTPVDIDHLLVRFVDCDIAPGNRYEYQIRIRMVNPNFGFPQWVSNPKTATEEKYRILLSPWTKLEGALTVPNEDFLFAYDPVAYRTEIAEAHKEQPKLRDRLQAKDNQAVVQIVKWMEEIRMENGKHEPVGGWVVADIPVGRGDFIGKKTFVKLPLWSSETNQYVFREISVVGAKKDKDQQPKGWLVDFSSKSILVDFEGGKVTTKTATRTLPTEEVATEMLIVRPDGKLLLRKSVEDAADENRKTLSSIWTDWLKKVETRPTTSTGVGSDNMFDRKP